jgi:hypothetical protein
MNRLFLGLTLLALLFSCTQTQITPPDDLTIEDPPLSEQIVVVDWIPLQVGNWWEYQCTTTMPDSTVIDSAPRTASITADSIINGNEYFYFESDAIAFPFDEHWVRDSSGYYVSHEGVKMFSYTDLVNILHEEIIPDLYGCTTSMMNCVFSREVPAGTFTCLMRQDSCEIYISSAEPTYYPYLFAAEDVGPVEFSNFFVSSGAQVEYKLMDYGN